MQGDDHKISCGSGSCDEGKELRCRNCTHSGIFGLDTALNKAKGVKNDEIQIMNDELRRNLNDRHLSSFGHAGIRASSFGAHLYNFAKFRFPQRHNGQT